MEILLTLGTLSFISFIFYSHKKLKLDVLEDKNHELVKNFKKDEDSKLELNRKIAHIDYINNSDVSEQVVKQNEDEQNKLQVEISQLQNQINKLLPEYTKKKRKLDEEESERRRERSRRESYYSSSSSSPYGGGSSWSGGGGGFSGGGASGGW